MFSLKNSPPVASWFEFAKNIDKYSQLKCYPNLATDIKYFNIRFIRVYDDVVNINIQKYF